jgi:hypothetical protein
MLRTLTPSPARALLLAFAASALSCSVLVDTKTTQCDVDTDCTNLGAAFAKATCQAQVCVAPVTRGCMEASTSTAPTVKLTFNITFTTMPAKPQPFIVNACGPLDGECTSPVAGPFSVPYGEPAEIDLPPGFLGSLQIKSPDGLPGQLFLGRPIVQDTKGYDVILPTMDTVKFLLLATQQDYTPEDGIFVITTRDCDRQPLAGVQVMNNVAGVGFYFQNQLPQKTLTATTAEGAAGYVNVPPGLVSISATLDGTPMTGTSAISRGGWVTYVEIFP